MIVDDQDVQRRLTALVEELDTAGYVRHPRWRAALLAVRRHVFVPRFWHDTDPGAYPARWHMVDNATSDYAQWLDAVYSNTTLATDLTGVSRTDGTGMHPQVTSSSTMPGLVIAMLEALDIDDVDPRTIGATTGSRSPQVLEIGTGTGYSTALLSEVLGGKNVTSIDVAPELTALARVRLAAHGYHPNLITRDGADGAPEHAPYDRVIATCGLDHVPPAWIVQTQPGGKILLNLLGPFNGFALVLLTVLDDGTADGRFLTQTGGFMPRRVDPRRAHDYNQPIERPATPAEDSVNGVDPRHLYTDRAWGLLAQSTLPGVRGRQLYLEPDDRDADESNGDGSEPPLATELVSADGGSWALVHHDPDSGGMHAVHQAGPRRLWDELEAARSAYLEAGRPPIERYRLYVDQRGTIAIRLDDKPATRA